MLQSFNFGPINVHLYGVFIGLGIIFTYLYSVKESKKFNLTENIVDITFLISLPLSLFFARIYHVLSSLSYYLSHPIETFYIWNGGLGIFGLILGAILGLFLASKVQKIPFYPLLNLLFPPILIAQSLGRIGNYFNQEGLGPNGFPTFFLESFLCLIAFLIYIFNKKRKDCGFTFYLISYGIIRFVTEFFRTDTWKIGSLHVAQLLSLTMIISGFLIHSKRCSKKHDKLL